MQRKARRRRNARRLASRRNTAMRRNRPGPKGEGKNRRLRRCAARQ